MDFFIKFKDLTPAKQTEIFVEVMAKLNYDEKAEDLSDKEIEKVSSEVDKLIEEGLKITAKLELEEEL